MPTKQPRTIIAVALALAAYLVAGCGGGGGGGGGGASGGGATGGNSTEAAVFDQVWSSFDQRYSFFVLKNIDWNQSRARYRNTAVSSATEQALFDTIDSMLLELQDGHVRLASPFESSAYTGWFDQYPENYDAAVIESNYLGATWQLSPQARLSYGFAAARIGYIHVGSLSGSGFGQDFVNIIQSFGGIDGLIIDVRNNGGGNDQNGEAIASRLASNRTLYRRVRFRDGPSHSDFGPYIDSFLDPIGTPVYTGRIAVLTNRRTASSAESFVLALKTLPAVTTLGDFTGGLSANPEQVSLPNGWTVTVSRWIEYLPDNSTFEGIGLSPDMRVDITATDAAALRDTILDAAIQLLQN